MKVRCGEGWRTITRHMRHLGPILALLGSTLALAACGGGGGGGGGGGDTGGGDGNQGAAYDAAFDICSPGLKATAEAYAVEPTQEAVAQVVVEQVSGGGQDEKRARAGCLAALAKAGG
jgi:hypothetical protein